jgi:hypothetical protein
VERTAHRSMSGRRFACGLMLVWLGWQVMHAFVSRALQHLALTDASLWQQRVENAGGSLEAKCCEARTYLEECRRSGRVLDVVYLDPMFPSTKRKSALPKRRMQWLRHYLDSRPLPPASPHDTVAGTGKSGSTTTEETEVAQLLQLARTVARKVVLKRADDGPLVGKPSSQISSSKIVRFDVYSGVLT